MKNMKKKKWLSYMDLADEKYVSEADPSKIQTKRSKRSYRWIILVASLSLTFTLIASLWLFIPFSTDLPDVSQYSESEYYSIIQKINALNINKPKYKNNFEKIISAISHIPDMFLATKEDADNSMVNDGGIESPSSYQEITDNQVSGVIEADRIKRSDSHIYYMYDNTLEIYSINGENSEKVGSYPLFDSQKMTHSYTHEWEFYLSADCRTVTVIAPYYEKDDGACVDVISLDVSEPSDIKRSGRFTVTGAYLSSRLKDGQILLITLFTPKLKDIDFSDESTFLPQIDNGNGAQSIPAGDIISPELLTSVGYSTVLSLDEKTLACNGSTAFLSYSQNVYVSNENIFAMRNWEEAIESGDTVKEKSMTEISCVSYSHTGFEYKGSVDLEGYVKDQYSLDEFDGMLRVVTTTSEIERKMIRKSGSIVSDDEALAIISTGNTSASLYCVSLSDWQILASVEKFAPIGETVRSVRFDGNTAYVCTSIQLSDPVFFFDLSDINNISCKDTGTIEGFSSSLINFKDGYLVGIGVGESWNTLKIEVYKEGTNNVISVCSYELENTYFSSDYKSYYVNRENGMIGLGITQYQKNSQSSNYILVMFDGYRIRQISKLGIDGDPQYMRGVYIDGYLYAFGENGMIVDKIS